MALDFAFDCSVLVPFTAVKRKIQRHFRFPLPRTLGGGKRGHNNVADTLLRTQMFRRLPVRATVVADTKFVSETQKMFLIFVRNILCPQQMFPRLRGMDTKQMFCVPLFCPPKKHHEQQYVRNNVSSFATTFCKSLKRKCARIL